MALSAWLILLLTHPLEFRTLIQFKVWHEQKRNITAREEHPTSGWDRASMRRCWELLDMTSRSFSAVIKELEGDLARTICLFYLVLRGLDTIEDDMTLSDDVKQPLLRQFHIHTITPGWKFEGSGPDERDRQLLVEYDKVVEEMGLLKSEYREVILDICEKMATGMADFSHKAHLAQQSKSSSSSSATEVISLSTVSEYDLYCHYVAGLVGEGLSRLLSASGKEAPWLGDQLELSNSVGLLLQKTNIIRDFREDAEEGRFFWPREIWSSPMYLSDFASSSSVTSPRDLCLSPTSSSSTIKTALNVQSAMIVDAMRHLTDALDYLKALKNQSVFNFCAIPVTMAIATLELCFMNPTMFERNIKIRKAEAANLIMRSTNPRDVACIFRDYCRKIHAKANPTDPSFLKISIICGKVEQWAEQAYPSFIALSGGTGSVKTSFDPFDVRSKILEKEHAIDASIAQKKQTQNFKRKYLKAKEEREKKEANGEIVREPLPEPHGPSSDIQMIFILIGVILAVLGTCCAIIYGILVYLGEI